MPEEGIEKARQSMPKAEDFELYEDNAMSVDVFSAMSTQWRRENGEAVGLDYAPLETVMRLVGVPRRARRQTFHDVRALELETLAVISERRR